MIARIVRMAKAFKTNCIKVKYFLLCSHTNKCFKTKFCLIFLSVLLDVHFQGKHFLNQSESLSDHLDVLKGLTLKLESSGVIQRPELLIVEPGERDGVRRWVVTSEVAFRR